MLTNDGRVVIKNEISPKSWHACKSSIPSMADDKKQQDKPKGSPFLVILTTEQARSIYRLRSESTAEGSSAKYVAGKSSLVSEMFGVSPKTIRDVWNRKTWIQVSSKF